MVEAPRKEFEIDIVIFPAIGVFELEGQVVLAVIGARRPVLTPLMVVNDQIVATGASWYCLELDFDAIGEEIEVCWTFALPSSLCLSSRSSDQCNDQSDGNLKEPAPA